MGKGGCCHIHRIGSGYWTVVDRECPLNLSERHGGQLALVTTSTTGVLARAVAHLESSYALACRAARDELLSPWGNTAMSIHLASAGLSRYLPEPVQAADHAGCLTVLHAAQREPLSLDGEHGLARLDLTQVRDRMATALTQAQSLPR